MQTCVQSNALHRVITDPLRAEMPLILSADVSNCDVCAVILHILPIISKKAIANAFRTLAPTEKNYSQIEKKALAISYAMKKFHKSV